MLILLSKTPDTYCKLNEINKNTLFQLRIADIKADPIFPKKEVTKIQDLQSIEASYVNDILFITRALFENRFNYQIIFLHELHHAYMVARNRAYGLNKLILYKDGDIKRLAPDFDINLLTPAFLEASFGKGARTSYSSFPGKSEYLKESLQDFQAILDRTLNNLQYFLYQLNSNQIDERLKKLLTTSSTYRPEKFLMTSNQKQFQQFKKDGVLDEQYRFTKPVFAVIPASGVKHYFSSVILNSADGSVNLINSTVVKADTKKEKLKAALLDGIYLLKEQQEKYVGYPVNLASEMDAHLHEVYGSYPKLYALLLSELADYHELLDEPVLKSCLYAYSMFAREGNINQASVCLNKDLEVSLS